MMIASSWESFFGINQQVSSDSESTAKKLSDPGSAVSTDVEPGETSEYSSSDSERPALCRSSFAIGRSDTSGNSESIGDSPSSVIDGADPVHMLLHSTVQRAQRVLERGADNIDPSLVKALQEYIETAGAMQQGAANPDHVLSLIEYVQPKVCVKSPVVHDTTSEGTMYGEPEDTQDTSTDSPFNSILSTQDAEATPQEGYDEAQQAKGMLSLQLAEQRKLRTQLQREHKALAADYNRKHAALTRIIEQRDRLEENEEQAAAEEQVELTSGMDRHYVSLADSQAEELLAFLGNTDAQKHSDSSKSSECSKSSKFSEAQSFIEIKRWNETTAEGVHSDAAAIVETQAGPLCPVCGKCLGMLSEEEMATHLDVCDAEAEDEEEMVSLI